MSALNTDLYQITMAAGYFCAGKVTDVATFELSVRRMPERRNFLIAAGLEQAIEYLSNLRFGDAEVAYLKGQPQFRSVPPDFFEFLKELRFTGDVFAVPEGTPVFASEPLLIVRAPIVQAQLVETFLLSTLAYQTLIASKAARCVLAAQGRSVIEFGSRRAHSAGAGPLAARAAYIGGCSGTSNTEAGYLYDIPVFGTAAHSWIMAYPSEEEAFVQLQKLLGETTVYLIDTYDTLEGARLAARLGRPIWGVRLDSGDLVALSKEVRRILDHAGLEDAHIVATNDLNEQRIARIIGDGAPIDSFGVGTELATSSDAPALSAVYKLVELHAGGSLTYTAKYSEDKSTVPGAKQVYRSADHDLIALQTECSDSFVGRPLVRPVMMNGKLLEPLPPASKIRERALTHIAELPADLRQIDRSVEYPVQQTEELQQLAESLRIERQLVRD